ncbi:MAG: carbamoyltransferase C-terminal domain-containing protein [Nitrososphaerales archaeon]
MAEICSIRHSPDSTALLLFQQLETHIGGPIPVSLVALIEKAVDSSSPPCVIKRGAKLGEMSWTGKLGFEDVVISFNKHSLPLIELDQLLFRLRFTASDGEMWLFVYRAPSPKWLISDSTLVLGLTKQGHDSAASVVDLSTGEILAFCQEERVSRIRHERRFPSKSIGEVLQQVGVSSADLGAIAVAHGLWWYTDSKGSKAPYVESFARLPIEYSKPDLPARNSVEAFRENLRSALAIDLSSPLPPLYFVNHHLSHVFAAMSTVPEGGQSTSVSVVVDGRGEWETTTAWIINEEEVRQLFHEEMPNSLGYFYNAFGWIFGWRRYGFEGRLMGLAPYGSPKNQSEKALHKKLQALIGRVLEPSNSLAGYSVNSEFLHGGYAPERREEHAQSNWWLSPFRLSPYFEDKLTSIVPPLSPGEVIDPGLSSYRSHCLLAAVLQQALSDAMKGVCDKAFAEQLGAKQLLLSGGVAHNASCNGSIARKFAPLGIKTLVPPYVSDEGLAIGAPAALGWVLGMSHVQTQTAQLGKSYTDSDLKTILSRYNVLSSVEYLKGTAQVEAVSEALRCGKGVALFLGRSECGARALGGRSILFPAHLEGSLEFANLAKGRASWRPVGLAVLEHRQQELFGLTSGSPFMNTCVEPSELGAKQFLSGLHPADRSTRLQVVTRASSPFLYHVLLELEKHKIFALVNTSFNREEPMVHSPEEALDTYYYLTGVDKLLMGSYWISGRSFKPGLLRAVEDPEILSAYTEFMASGNAISLFEALLSVEVLDHQPHLIASRSGAARAPLIIEFYSEIVRHRFVSELRSADVHIEVAPGLGHEELVRQFKNEIDTQLK